MRDVIVGWLGLLVIVAAVLATVATDVFRQREAVVGDPTDPVAPRQPGGRVFWLTVVSVVLTVIAAVATVVRLTTLA